MKIAVVIPAFNVAPYLHEAMASVCRQTHADWTMVVVDDGSTDGTAAVAAAFRDPRIRLLRQMNAGVSAARNAGAAAVLAPMPNGADAILFLDGDDWLAPNALASLADTLAGAPSAVAACGRFARVGPGHTVRSQAPPHGRLLERLLCRNLFANGGHLLLRAAAVAAAGGFRADLSYGEDWEDWTRLALLGEFAAVRSAAPLLFVRERPGSACLLHATDPAAYRAAIAAMQANAGIARQLGAERLAALGRRTQAEIAWIIGRELIRHGRRRAGLGWLLRSIRAAPTAKRLLLVCVSAVRAGPFLPYRTVAIPADAFPDRPIQRERNRE